MMQMVQRWKVIARFSGRPDIIIWIDNNFLSNVMRTVAEMQFSENGLEQPTAITIEAVGFPTNPTATFASSRGGA